MNQRKKHTQQFPVSGQAGITVLSKAPKCSALSLKSLSKAASVGLVEYRYFRHMYIVAKTLIQDNLLVGMDSSVVYFDRVWLAFIFNVFIDLNC